LQLRELTLLLRREQATREMQGRRIALLEEERLTRQPKRSTSPRPNAPTKHKRPQRPERIAKAQRTATNRLRKRLPAKTSSSRKRRR
jgi:hypothetical protein